MNSDGKKGQYGLILSKKAVSSQANVPLAFAESDGEEDRVDVTGTNRSASSLRAIKEAERLQERALAEDPSIFDYDASYDAIQAKKNITVAETKAKDKERKSKYAEEIIKSHKRRELEKQSREERKQQKERVQEGDEFADKEVFVTGAYRKQMEEVQKFREQEARENSIDDATAIGKQRIWQSGLARTLLSTLARDGDDDFPLSQLGKTAMAETSEDVVKFRPRKQGRIRQRSVEHERSPMHESEERREAGNVPDVEQPSSSLKTRKNFDGDLKPGLNKPATKHKEERVLTKAERLRRQFTPTSSDDEQTTNQEGVLTDHVEKRKNDMSEGYHRSDAPESPRKAFAPKISTANNKESSILRLQSLKKILRQRNSNTEIAACRKRFFDRKESAIVTLPM